jgi:hypothetical protein
MNQKSNWTVAKVFTDGNGYAVEVSTTPGRRGELLYSVRCGQMIERNGFTSLSFNIRAAKDPSSMVHVGLAKPFAEALATLLGQAQEWIVTELAIQHDSDIDARIVREAKQADWGKPKTKVTGKTERNRAKRRGGAAA